MMTYVIRFTLIFLFSSVLSGVLSAQFNTVINIPPESDPGTIQSDVQLNLLPFGTLGSNFDAGEFNGTSTNVEVNITGGSIGDFFTANRGSTVNVNGGLIGDFLTLASGQTSTLTAAQSATLSMPPTAVM